MASLFQKIRTVTLGNLHALLDKVIDLNSVAAVRQHIRDLEEAKEEIADSAAVAKARVASLTNEAKALQVKIQNTNDNIDLVLSDSDATNDHLAEPLEVRLIGYEEDLATRQAELEEATTTANALAAATSKLQTKHQEMLVNLRRLESLERAAKAKEKAAAALRQAAKAGTSGAAASVDSVERRLREKAVVADARFDRAMGEAEDGVDTGVTALRARQRLAERRARLAVQQTAAPDTVAEDPPEQPE